MKLKNSYGIKLNANGSILVLTVIFIALIISLGVSLLSVNMVHYQIKKSNSEIKQSFYMCENGLNIAYINAYDIVNEAIEDSKAKAESYLSINPYNEIEANIIFKDNYKLYIINNILNCLASNTNPIIELNNFESLISMNDELTLELKSIYTSNFNIEKIIGANLMIKIPDYKEVTSVEFDADKLFMFNKWDIVK